MSPIHGPRCPSPQKLSERGIVVRGEPDRHAARLQGLSGQFVPWLARPGDRVRFQAACRRRVEGGDVAAMPSSRRGADHDLTLGTGQREVITLLVVIDVVSQTTVPVFASRAMTWASTVAK